ncbi:Dual specificity protein phosphatase MPK-4 [Chionoecetes opilio]|uniref:protein-tyrosine-phosphatase n=1 Tax=Chionoecetes opilio TaxID=41210 RepID=A0A8J8W9C8_CHIOP|nr:Dual specificity protein phosphatase MPK-4 [Chionoecetes opilio]
MQKTDDEDLLPDVVNLDQIEEGLYLGNLTAATDIKTLSRRGVSHILTVDSKPLPSSITSLAGMSFMYIQDEALGLDSKHRSVVHPNPNTDADYGPVAYKCRNCRLSLISLRSVVDHCPGEAPLWTDSKWSDAQTKPEGCGKGIFTFPIAWMGDVTEPLHGKLHCPKCHAKLGSFSWHEGCRCSCEARIIPAFYFIPSKLDKCL